MATHDPPDEWRQPKAEDRAALCRGSLLRRGCAVLHAAFTGHRSGRVYGLLAFGLVSVLVLAGLIVVRGEPMLEGRPVRQLVREAKFADCEAANVFRRNGTKSVPGLVHVMESGPPFGAGVARQLKKRSWIYKRLPSRLQNWASKTGQETMLRETDREWAVVWCASLNGDAAAAHPALLRACDDPNWRVRMEAVKSLLRTEVAPAKALPPLTRLLLKDPSSEVRSTAAFYIGLFHEKAQPAIPALRQATEDPGLWVAANARQALEKVEAAVARKREEPLPAGPLASPR